MRDWLLTAAALVLASSIAIGQVAAVRPEGSLHGFLVLRTEDGTQLAEGDLLRLAHGGSVTNELRFHFADGSVYDDTTVFTQNSHFQVVRDHLVQKGPAFPDAIDMVVDARTGTATVHYTDEHGNAKSATEHFKTPPDLVNGILPTILQNVTPETAPKSVSMVVATPTPRLVKLGITVAGEDTFRIAGSARRATHYVLNVELGGITGMIAPLVGKQPPDSHIWISHDDAPQFVRGEQPFFDGAPLWRIELASPVWTRTP